MEAMAGSCILDGEWESLYKTFSSEPDLDFTFLLSHNSHFPSDHLPPDEGLISSLLTGDENPIAPSLPFCTQEAIPTPNSNHFSQASSTSDLSGSSNGSTGYVNTLHQLTQLINIDDQIPSLSSFDFLLDNGLLVGQVSSDHTTINGDVPLIEGPSAKRKCSDQIEMEAEVLFPVQPKKRARAFKNGRKGKGKMQSKKNQDELAAEEENIGGTINGQNSSSKVSDNESNVSHEVINGNGKKRANRGAATDPQSLYARRRRERINERLRILQTLVPNGTKVDISTMLEEAVHYVKFLQLQIKLLSSDEMWMYAPLAYNGFDLGLYKSFSPYMQCQ